MMMRWRRRRKPVLWLKNRAIGICLSETRNCWFCIAPISRIMNPPKNLFPLRPSSPLKIAFFVGDEVTSLKFQVFQPSTIHAPMEILVFASGFAPVIWQQNVECQAVAPMTMLLPDSILL